MNAKNQTYACIDLGSNMCRMLIGHHSPSKQIGFSILNSISILISLGKDSTFIDQKGFYRTCKALDKCTEILQNYNSNIKILCIATAIFRSASNAQEILKLIYNKYRFEFRVIDPGEEIMLSAMGCQDIFLNGFSFVMDMGGGSTEIGVFRKNKSTINIIEWISIPFGLFHFGNTSQSGKIIPTDAYKSLNNFTTNIHKYFKDDISIIICRSGVMSLLTTYICRRQNLVKSMIHGRVFGVDYIIKCINQIIQMSDLEILQEKLVANTSHLTSTRGTMIFTKEILQQLPIKFVILGNGGVKEGMMNMACKAI